MTSNCRQNFHEECEAFINKIVNLELYTSNCYLALASFFDRDDVALKGLCGYFFRRSRKERSKAEELLNYQNYRGGRVVLQAVDRPAESQWDKPVKAIEFALKLEKQLNETMINLHGVADKHHDPHLTDFVKENFLNERVEAINLLSRFLTNFERVGDGLGVFIFDKHIKNVHAQ